MIVLNPNNISHSFSFIPRFYGDNFQLFLYNENGSFLLFSLLLENGNNLLLENGNNILLEYGIVNYSVINNGIITISFDYNFVDGEKYQIKITENNEIVYRDKLFVTSQNAQDFKATKDLYYYE